jgi:uncharacterized protein (DUF983 family)
VDRFRPAVRQTQVGCPACGDGTLVVRPSCLRTRFACPWCGADFDLAELARRLDDEAFGALEQAVGGRLSDRV